MRTIRSKHVGTETLAAIETARDGIVAAEIALSDAVANLENAVEDAYKASAAEAEDLAQELTNEAYEAIGQTGDLLATLRSLHEGIRDGREQHTTRWGPAHVQIL